MKKVFSIIAIILSFIIIGCKDKRAPIIEAYISNIDGTVTDFNFKLNSIVDLSPIYPLDSINIIVDQNKVQEEWRNIDSVNAKYEEYGKKFNECIALRIKFAGYDTQVFRENGDWYMNARSILRKLQYYYGLPKDTILAQRSICVYSINNPFLNGVKQTVTDTIYFSEDYANILKRD